MKILYVLVSSDLDYYYEQALVSVTSLRYVKSNVFVTLLVDDKTDATLVGNRSKLKSLVDEYKVVSFDSSVNSMERSRSLKTRMRNVIDGDFLYVDVDTVWCDSYDDKVFTDDVMAVPDGHCSLSEHPLEYKIIETMKKLGFLADFCQHFNGGVLFLKDSILARNFSRKWNDLWHESCNQGIAIDQPSLNEANHRMGCIIKNLPGEYNAQIGRCLNYLASAKIIHYFATWNADESSESFYLLSKKTFLEEVKKNGVTENIMCAIRNPKGLFDKNTYILNYRTTKKVFTPNGNMLLNICQSEKNSEKRMRFVVTMIAKIYYKTIPFFYPIYKILKK